VSLVPGPTSLCVVSVLGVVYLSPATGGCARPATSLSVPSATANAYFCPGFLDLLTPVSTPRCLPGEPVYAVTKPPQAVSDVAGVSYGSPTATGNVLANDLYISLNPVTVTALTSSGVVTSTPTGFRASLADGSTLTVSGAGAYTFTASAGFFSTCTANATDVFGYTITNAYGQASSASLTVTATCLPPQSQAVNDTGSLTYDSAGAPTATGNLLANDNGLATDPSAITNVNSVAPVSGVITKAGTYGTLVVQTTGPNAGNYTYTPSGLPATCGPLTDTFTYALTDGYARASSASLTVTLSCDQAAPIALSGTADVSSSSPTATGNLIAALVTISVGDTVHLTSVSAGGGALTVSGSTALDLTDGVLTVSPNGALQLHRQLELLHQLLERRARHCDLHRHRRVRPDRHGEPELRRGLPAGRVDRRDRRLGRHLQLGDEQHDRRRGHPGIGGHLHGRGGQHQRRGGECRGHRLPPG
jgi:hypothetical protein